MLVRLDFADVEALIARHSTRKVELRAASFAVLLSSLQALEWRQSWIEAGEDLSDDDWDDAQQWVNDAFYELVTIYTCPSGGGEGVVSSAILEERQVEGTQGGGCAGNTWQQRTINNILTDPDSIVTIAANLFTPVEGDFLISGHAQGFDCGAHKLRLWNDTQDTLVYEGQNSYNSIGDSTQTMANLDVPFTADGIDEYRIDHYTKTAHATNGLGVKVSKGEEVYLSMELSLLGDEA